MTDKYAIVTTINTRRYYWRVANPHKPARREAGSWSDFIDATIFTAGEKGKYSLPANGQWVSVLRGMGTGSFYPALTELNDLQK